MRDEGKAEIGDDDVAGEVLRFEGIVAHVRDDAAGGVLFRAHVRDGVYRGGVGLAELLVDVVVRPGVRCLGLEQDIHARKICLSADSISYHKTTKPQ